MIFDFSLRRAVNLAISFNNLQERILNQVQLWSLRPASWRVVHGVMKLTSTGTTSIENILSNFDDRLDDSRFGMGEGFKFFDHRIKRCSMSDPWLRVDCAIFDEADDS